MYQAEWMLKGRVRLSANFTTGAPESAQPPQHTISASVYLSSRTITDPPPSPPLPPHTLSDVRAHTHTHIYIVPPDSGVL